MTTPKRPVRKRGQHRIGTATVNEPECRRLMRRLGIASAAEWKLWCRANGVARKRLCLPARPEKDYNNLRFWAEYGAQHPRHWAEFQRGRSRNGDEAARQELARWARYAGRYKAASGYRGIRFSGMKDASGRGYSAAFAVFLAYTALEACQAAIDPQGRTGGSLVNLPLASSLRTAFGRRFGLADELHANLRVDVERFMTADDESAWPRSQDVLVMARAIRHLVAHGIFTPWGGRVVSARAAAMLQDLADAVLEHSAWLFSGHVWPKILAGREAQRRLGVSETLG